MKRDLEELEAEVRTILDCDTDAADPNYIVEQDLMEEILELIQESLAPPKPKTLKKFLCYTAIIETTDPDVIKVAAKVRRELELLFGERIVGTEWSVREGTR